MNKERDKAGERGAADFYYFPAGWLNGYSAWWIVQWSHWSGVGYTKRAAIQDLKRHVFATGRAPKKYWARRPVTLSS